MYFVDFKILNENCTPIKATKYSAGYDLKANIPEKLIIYPNEIKKIPLGIIVYMPPKLEFQIRPRSGLALKGLTIINTPGTVDADYNLEVCALVINLGDYPITINPYDRICQGVFSELPDVTVKNAVSLEETRMGGFGSTN